MVASSTRYPDMSEFEDYRLAGGGWRFNVSIPAALAAFHKAIASADVRRHTPTARPHPPSTYRELLIL